MTEVCGVCAVAEAEHGAMNHEFSVEGILTSKKDKAPLRQTVRVAPDLILRQALITKGLITAQDLNNAEVMLRERFSGNAGH